MLDPAKVENEILKQLFDYVKDVDRFERFTTYYFLKSKLVAKNNRSRSQRKLELVNYIRQFYDGSEIDDKVKWMCELKGWDVRSWWKNDKVSSNIIFDLLYGIDGLLSFKADNDKWLKIALDITLTNGDLLEKNVHHKSIRINKELRVFHKVIILKAEEHDSLAPHGLVDPQLILDSIKFIAHDRSRGPYVFVSLPSQHKLEIRRYNRWNTKDFIILN
jgi:hypothetical protein